MTLVQGNRLAKIEQFFFFTLISLAAFGLIIQLITDPLSQLSTVLVIAAVIAIFYGIFRYMIGENRWTSSKGNMKKQTVLTLIRPTGQNKAKRDFPKEKTEKLRRKEYPFKVIEGNKGKKKNSFHNNAGP